MSVIDALNMICTNYSIIGEMTCFADFLRFCFTNSSPENTLLHFLMYMNCLFAEFKIVGKNKTKCD